MPTEWPTDASIDAKALEDALLGLGDLDDLAYDPDEDDGDALRSVTQGIAENHVDVVARFARSVFAGRDAIADHQHLAAALSSLVRLAEATGDQGLRDLLADMLDAVTARAARGELQRDRARFLPVLTRFVEAFADRLRDDEAARLREIVRWEPDRVPLLAELRGVKGIGPRRLERLYCCGLYTVEVVAHADPADVAVVCGLPVALSGQVVGAAREFAVRERTKSLDDARMRIRDFARMTAALGDPVPDQVVHSALAAVDELDTRADGPGEDA